MLSGFLFVWPIPLPEHFSFQLEPEDGDVFRGPTHISSSTLYYIIITTGHHYLLTIPSETAMFALTSPPMEKTQILLEETWSNLDFWLLFGGTILGTDYTRMSWIFLKICWDFNSTFDLDIQVNNVGTMSRSQSCPQRPRIWRCPGAEVAGITSFCYQPYKPYKLRRTVINMYTIPHLLYLSFCLPLFKNRVRFGFR